MSDQVIPIKPEFTWDAVMTEREARWFAECMRYLREVWEEADINVRNEIISDLRRVVEKYQEVREGKR